MKQILSLIVLILITCYMFYQVIIREHWSLKISALFIALLGLAVNINVVILMYQKSVTDKNKL